MLHPAGPRNSLVDVPSVRVSHLTRVSDTGSERRRARTGITVVSVLPPEGRYARPAAVVASGGHTEMTGLCYIEDFGFVMSPIVVTGLRAVGRVYDAMISHRAVVGWPPLVVGLDDGRLCDPRAATFGERDVIATFESARTDAVLKGAVGAATGLVAFGYKSGLGSASRSVTVRDRTHMVGVLALINLGRGGSLRIGRRASAAPAAAARGAPPLLGSAFVLTVTDAPLDDRQCRRLAAVSCLGLGRLGLVPGGRESLVACAVSTGVLLTRGDRTAAMIDAPRSSESVLGALAEATTEAAEEAGTRTLTSVAPEEGTSEYPTMPK